MIIPSIDLVEGRAVQLVGGEVEAIDAGNPVPILERFSVAGEVAVIDIDAARGEGTNRDLIRRLCRLAPVRVGGGIRDAETALDWLDAGAEKVIIGTGATPELLSRLPAHRVIVALDSRNGDVVTHGWRRTTGASVLERIAELRDLCGGFLVTFVEREGRMRGTDVDRAEAAIAAAGESRVTIAGGVATSAEIAAIDGLGADTQVGMALYSDTLGLAEAITAIRAGATGRVGTAQFPAFVGEGVFWVEVEDLGDNKVRVVSTSMSGSGRRSMAMVLQRGSGGLGDLFRASLN
ncbi:MAG: HisA/HisF-related TIM barrel protein, partial [Acidimicrobiia bacterium]